MYKIHLLVVISILFCCACSDLLDKEPKESISYSKALTSETSIKYALNGIYSKLQSPNYYGRNLFVIEDLMAENSKISPDNSDKFTAFYNHSFTATEPEILGLWETCYSVIWQANEVMSAIENLADSTSNAKQMYAEALCLRALAYTDLIRLFALPYKAKSFAEGANGKGGHLGVPLVLKGSIDSISSLPRASVAEVYKQIYADLEKSISLFQVSDATPFYFSKEAAQALLARAALNAGNDQLAFNTAIDVYLSGKYSLIKSSDYVQSWAEPYTSESIFSVAMSATDNNGTDALGYLYSANGYNDVYPTADLMSIFSESDIRTQLYSATEIKKYPDVDGNIGYNNIPVIRFSEMMLIIAEVAAKYPEYQHLCCELLNEISLRADSTAIAYTEADDLKAAVRLERRKELAFEGCRFSDLMRYNSNVERNDCSAAKCEIIYPSKTCVLPIPQHEMNANSNMLQNTGF